MNLKKFNDKYGSAWLLIKIGKNGSKYRLIHFPSRQHSVCLISTIDSAISIIENNDNLNNRSYFRENVWKYIYSLDLFGEVLRHLFFVTEWQHPPYQTFNINTNVTPIKSKSLNNNSELYRQLSRKCFEADVEGIGRVEMSYHRHFPSPVLMFTMPDGSILINRNFEQELGWMWTTKEYV